MSTVEQLRKLAQMHAAGALNAAEYASAKAALLGDVPDAEAPPIRPFAPRDGASNDPRPLLGIAILSALVLGLLSMLFFGLSIMTGATIGIVTLGGVTLLLHRNTDDDTI